MHRKRRLPCAAFLIEKGELHRHTSTNRPVFSHSRLPDNTRMRVRSQLHARTAAARGRCEEGTYDRDCAYSVARTRDPGGRALGRLGAFVPQGKDPVVVATAIRHWFSDGHRPYARSRNTSVISFDAVGTSP